MAQLVHVHSGPRLCIVATRPLAHLSMHNWWCRHFAFAAVVGLAAALVVAPASIVHQTPIAYLVAGALMVLVLHYQHARMASETVSSCRATNDVQMYVDCKYAS